MLKKVLGRAVAGTAAAGMVLVPSAFTVAPQFANVACEYPASAPTTTTVTLNNSVAQYGTRGTTATVTVTNPGNPDFAPYGKVKIAYGKVTVTKSVSDGTPVTLRLSRWLDAQKTYKVSARYMAECNFQSSRDTTNYTVTKAGVNVNPTVQNARAAKFRATLRGVTGVNPQGGRAAFVVRKANGVKVRSAMTGVDQGVARVNLKNLARGKYTLTVTYAGTKNFKSASDSVSFGVRRR